MLTCCSFSLQYDKVHTSITPFLALAPKTMAERLKHFLEKEAFVYIVESQRSKPIQTTGERGENPRAQFMKVFQSVSRRSLRRRDATLPG